MIVGDLGGIHWLWGERGLQLKLHTGRGIRLLFETEVFIEDPEDVRRKALLSQETLPGIQGIFEWRTIVPANGFHVLLGWFRGEPVNKKRNPLLDLYEGVVAEHGAGFGDIS